MDCSLICPFRPAITMELKREKKQKRSCSIEIHYSDIVMSRKKLAVYEKIETAPELKCKFIITYVLIKKIIERRKMSVKQREREREREREIERERQTDRDRER